MIVGGAASTAARQLPPVLGAYKTKELRRAVRLHRARPGFLQKAIVKTGFSYT